MASSKINSDCERIIFNVLSSSNLAKGSTIDAIINKSGLKKIECKKFLFSQLKNGLLSIGVYNGVARYRLTAEGHRFIVSGIKSTNEQSYYNYNLIKFFYSITSVRFNSKY